MRTQQIQQTLNHIPRAATILIWSISVVLMLLVAAIAIYQVARPRLSLRPHTRPGLAAPLTDYRMYQPPQASLGTPWAPQTQQTNYSAVPRGWLDYLPMDK